MASSEQRPTEGTGWSDRSDPILAAGRSRNRFEAIVREMTNTLLPHRALRGPQHGARLLLLDRHRRQPAARRRRGAAGARASAPGCRPARCASCTPTSQRATPFCTTIPISATPTPPTTRSWCRSSSTASTSSPPAPRPTRPTAATPSRRTYMPFAGDVYEEGALNLPLRPRSSSDYAGRRRHHPHVPAADPGARRVVRRLPGGGRRGADRRAPAQGAGRALRPGDDQGTSSREWLDYSERRMDAGDPQAAGAASSRRHSRARPDPRPSRRRPGQGRASRSTPRRGKVDGRPARQPRLHARRAQRLRGLRARRLHDRPASTASTEDVPRNAGSFRRDRGAAARGLVAGGLVEFPHSGSVATTNVAQPAHQRHAERLLPSSATARAWPRAAGALGRRLSRSSPAPTAATAAPYVNQLVIGNNGGPGVAALRRLDHLRDARLRGDDLHRQRRDARAASTRCASARCACSPTPAAPGGSAAARRRRSIYGPTATPMRVFYLADFAAQPAAGRARRAARAGRVGRA